MINFDLTTKVEIFVAHSGPKLSYSNKPLGDEFFVKSHNLLFEQGIGPQKLKLDFWDELPIFFLTNAECNCPFDIFAASFFLLTRYEECMPYLKTNSGYFDPSQSISMKFDFLELPIIDLWVSKFQKQLASNFHQTVKKRDHKASKKILLEVPLAFRYSNRSFLENLEDFISSIWKLNFRQLIIQILVLIRLKNDPFDTFDFWDEWFNNTPIKPQIFFLFSQSSSYQVTTSIFNLRFRKIIKKTGDFFSLGLLTSVKAQIDSKKQIQREKSDFQKLTNRTIFDVRLSNGIINLRKDYEMLYENEFKNDFSMGYLDRIGFRAGTATPYYFYDVSREFQLSLKLTPIFATEESLKKIINPSPFEKLRAVYEMLPLESSILSIVLTNGFLDPNLKNDNLQKGLLDFISD
ncbi:hypothetical protein DEJ39_07340 [Bacteroidetes bacterium SCGC AAA795-G10]|nr:hypothetical protein DEJ39_07340 [Bacteroidetes bacterium SCGC AAA795-G10]